MKPDFKKSELIPAIVQDSKTHKVLMLGYMNKESWKITQETGKVCFYSRSRQELWTKGESSGNFLHVVQLFLDCDRDTILIKANADGPTCHTGSETCFGETGSEGLAFLSYLGAFLKKRKKEMPKGSYTTKLFKKGPAKISQKVGEEAVELVIESMLKNDEDFLNEAADLMYHLMVLLIDRGCSLEDVASVLEKRHS